MTLSPQSQEDHRPFRGTSSEVEAKARFKAELPGSEKAGGKGQKASGPFWAEMGEEQPGVVSV